MGMSQPRRGQVYLVKVDSAQGNEIQKTRPYVIVSPETLNANLNTFLMVPLTQGGHDYPYRVASSFQEKSGFYVPDQLRVVDRSRLIRYMGDVTEAELSKVLEVLRRMFVS